MGDFESGTLAGEGCSLSFTITLLTRLELRRVRIKKGNIYALPVSEF
jgi:hypothetical protein